MTYQEKLVDGIIADYLESKFVGVKDKLGKTPKYFKRGAKASIMGNDRRIYELIKSLEEKNNTDEYLTYFDELVNAYRKYVEVADCEVKEFGEVMTPITLVEEMLNKLPSDVWSNPNLKWLDPCAGVGTFPSIVVQRLMKGLEEFEKNPIKRYRHIIEEMVYVCELQPKNLFVYHCVFDKDDTNELNTYCGSFLDEKFNKHMNNVWGVEKFDIIIGNPPYNNSQTQTTEKRGGGSSLWDKFVIKSLEILNDNKFLCFVHPSMWRKPESKNSKNKGLWNVFTSNQILYLEIHNSVDGLKTFNAATRYDWYVIEKKPIYKKTIIIDEDGIENKIDLREWKFLPNKNFKLVKSILADGDDKRCELIWNTYYHTANGRYDYVSQNKSNDFKYPLVHSTNKDGNRFYWTNNKNNNQFNISKVIFGESGINNSILDVNGEYGMTQSSMAIKFDTFEEGEQIKQSIESDKFKILLDSVSWGNFRIDYRLFTYFKKDFYKQFLND